MQQLLHPTKEVQKPWFLLAFFCAFLSLLKERHPPEAISETVRGVRIPTPGLRPGSE